MRLLWVQVQDDSLKSSSDNIALQGVGTRGAEADGAGDVSSLSWVRFKVHFGASAGG